MNKIDRGKDLERSCFRFIKKKLLNGNRLTAEKVFDLLRLQRERETQSALKFNAQMRKAVKK